MRHRISQHRREWLLLCNKLKSSPQCRRELLRSFHGQLIRLSALFLQPPIVIQGYRMIVTTLIAQGTRCTHRLILILSRLAPLHNVEMVLIVSVNPGVGLVRITGVWQIGFRKLYYWLSVSAPYSVCCKEFFFGDIVFITQTTLHKKPSREIMLPSALKSSASRAIVIT